MLKDDHPFEVVSSEEFPVKIKVIGIGGAGGNAVNNMVDHGVSGVEFVAINTDKQDLEKGREGVVKLLIGETITNGMGAGGDPEVGRRAAEESEALIIDVLGDAQMVFITAGMGGGTGTGAAPVVAKIAKDMGILTVAVVTTPFSWEKGRHDNARLGIKALREHTDALIVVSNDRIGDLNPDEKLLNLFKRVDDVLRQAVQGVTDLIGNRGYINTDFNDVKAVLRYKGKAFMSIAESAGENRAEEVVRLALSNPLVDTEGIAGAKGVLFTLNTGDDFTYRELTTVSQRIAEEVDDDCTVVYGWVLDPSLNGSIRLTVIATGIEGYDGEAVDSSETQKSNRDLVHGVFKCDLDLSDDRYDGEVPGMLRRFLDDSSDFSSSESEEF